MGLSFSHHFPIIFPSGVPQQAENANAKSKDIGTDDGPGDHYLREIAYHRMYNSRM